MISNIHSAADLGQLECHLRTGRFCWDTAREGSQPTTLQSNWVTYFRHRTLWLGRRSHDCTILVANYVVGYSLVAIHTAIAGDLRESVLHRYARYCNIARRRLLIDQQKQSVNLRDLSSGCSALLAKPLWPIVQRNQLGH